MLKNFSYEQFKKLCQIRATKPITTVINTLDSRSKMDKWAEKAEKREDFSKLSSKDNLITGNFFDSFFDELVKSDKKEFWYIGPPDVVRSLFDHYYNTPWEIQGIYQLGGDDIYYSGFYTIFFDSTGSISRPLPMFKYYLFHFTKNKVDKVNIGFSDYDEPIKNYEFNITKKKYSLEWYPVLLNKDSNPVFECIDVPLDNFQLKYLDFFSRYRKRIKDTFGLPEKDETIGQLKDYVEFIEPSDIKEGDIMVIRPDSPYPFNNIVGVDLYTDKKQMFKANDGKNYIHVECEDGMSFVNEIDAVFRCRKSDLRQYLCFYINCNENIIVAEYLKHCNLLGNPGDITELPVFIPKDLSNYNDPTIVLSELYLKLKNRFKCNENEVIKKNVIRDLEELKICRDHGAYKAAIILAGSLLEAVLLAWLSEIGGENYFLNDKKYKFKVNEYATRDASDLDDYIKAIQSKYHFDNPPWDQQDSPPNVIRQKRNLVRPKKLLLVPDDAITEATCEEVYNYLNYVIDYWEKTKNND